MPRKPAELPPAVFAECQAPRCGEFGLRVRMRFWTIRRLVEIWAEGEEMTDQEDPFSGLALDRAIHLRWVLRDIVGKRTKLSPVSPDDLRTLIEMGLVEMRG
jgi:hypothetical protein